MMLSCITYKNHKEKLQKIARQVALEISVHVEELSVAQNLWNYESSKKMINKKFPMIKTPIGLIRYIRILQVEIPL